MSSPDNHDTGMQTTRTVSCPTCTGPSLYTPDNRFRPFCSERCKRVDLGAWASDSFRVADVTPFPDAEGSVH